MERYQLFQTFRKVTRAKAVLDVAADRPYVPRGMETLVAPSPAKGRPREFCVDEALTAALRVFWQHGYEGASLTELTAAMGITKPSLYAAYGNKEALFHKALDLYEREKLAYMRTALDAPTSRGVAERLLMGALEMQSSTCDPKGCLGVIGALACSPQSASIRDDVLARRGSSQAALIERFVRAKEEGDLPEAIDPTALAHYLFTVMQGLAVQAGAGMVCTDLKALVDTTLQVWPGR